MKLTTLIVVSSTCALLTACSSGSVQDAKIIVQKAMRAPSSFSMINGEEMWAGKHNGGYAYIVRIEYDGQNGFGATLRDCKIVAFTNTAGDLRWDPSSGLATCENPSLDAATAKAMRKYHFGA